MGFRTNKIIKVNKMPHIKGTPAWNKGISSPFKGKKLEEIVGIDRAKEISNKITLGLLGKTHTEERRRNNSLANKGRIPPNKGKKLEEYVGIERAKEIKNNLSIANTGKKQSEESRRTIWSRKS